MALEQQTGVRVIDGQRKPAGYEALTVSSTAKGGTIPTGATGALITVESADVRWRDDGVAPTATVGNPITAGDPPFFYTGDLSALRFIRQSTTDATVHLNYYF